MTDQLNSNLLSKSSDILSHSFYVEKSAAKTRVTANQEIASTLSKITEEVSHKVPYAEVPNLLLPLLSFDEYKTVLSDTKKTLELAPNKESKISIEFQNQLHMLLINVLDNWTKVIDRVLKYKTVDYLSSLRLLMESIKNEIRNGEDIIPVVIMISTMVISGSYIGATGGSTSSSSSGLISFNSISEAISSLDAFVQKDMRAELGLIGAWYACLGMFPITIMEPYIIKTTDAEEKDLDYLAARNYASLIIKYLRGSKADGFIMSTFAHIFDSETSDGNAMKRFIAIAKLVILMTTLALLYKKETGKVTSIEIAAYLQGTMELKSGGLKSQLIQLIRTSLADIPYSERSEIVEAILAYFDSDPEVDDLLQPQHVFRQMFKNADFNFIAQQAI